MKDDEQIESIANAIDAVDDALQENRSNVMVALKLDLGRSLIIDAYNMITSTNAQGMAS